MARAGQSDSIRINFGSLLMVLGTILGTGLGGVLYLDGKMTGLATQVHGIDTRLVGLESAVENVDQQIQGMNDDIVSVVSRVERLEAKMTDFGFTLGRIEGAVVGIDPSSTPLNPRE